MKRLGGLVALLLVAAGCGGGPRGTGLTGEVIADGSSTVFPITQAVAEEFQYEEPGVEIAVGTSGTGGGFEKFCRGEADISNASREIKDEEAQLCARRGIEYLELEVALDGLTVVVNPDNGFVDCLTAEELERIWRPGSSVQRWRDVRPSFPNDRIALYGPGTDSGTFDYFTEAIVGEGGESRADYTASEDDNVLVQGVSGDENALGYFGFAYYEQNTDKLKALKVDGGDGCVAPTVESIRSGEYKPLSRPLFVYVSKASAARPEVERFMDFYLENVAGLARDVGYVALSDPVIEEMRRRWETFSA